MLRRRIAQPGPCCRHTPCERCEETWNPGWQLAHSGTGPGPPFRSSIARHSAASATTPWLPSCSGADCGGPSWLLSEVADLQQREEHWVFADLIGKGGHIRTVPIPDWVAEAVAVWLREAGVTEGAVFRAINKAGRIAPNEFSPKVIWGVVKQASARCGLANVAPHDLRRTCARLCHQAGGELEQIQFLLGHVSVQTTERYLGCKQRLRNAVNDNIGLEPQA